MSNLLANTGITFTASAKAAASNPIYIPITNPIGIANILFILKLISNIETNEAATTDIKIIFSYKCIYLLEHVMSASLGIMSSKVINAANALPITTPLENPNNTSTAI